VNSVLYQIPTEIFNEYMMLGRLNDKEDLDALVEKICLEKPVVSELYGYTDIWVGVGGNWSGLPSMHFKVPTDVFECLVEKGNTEKTIGRLVTDDDLTKLIEQTRYEISHGPVESGSIIVRSKPTNTEVKGCGHTCTTSSLKSGAYFTAQTLYVAPVTGVLLASLFTSPFYPVASVFAQLCMIFTFFTV